MRNEYEDMVRWWTITLITVLNGINIAEAQMEVAGEGKRGVAILIEDVRSVMNGFTPNQKVILARQFALLGILADEN
jgi:hypothetical protein